MQENVERYVSGRVDAISFRNGKPSAIIDWKSDTEIGEQKAKTYSQQLAIYLAVTGAPLGLVVYLTSGAVQRVHLPAN